MAALLANGSLAVAAEVHVGLAASDDARPPTVQAEFKALDRPGERVTLSLAPPHYTRRILLEPGLWQVSAKTPGFFVPDRHLTVRSSDEALDHTIDLWPAMKWAPRLTSRQLLPSSLDVYFSVQPSTATGRPLRGRVSCPISNDAASCELPRGRMDIRVWAVGFVPQYLWAVKVSQTAAPPTLHLTPGASVAGYCLSAAGQPAPDCRVELTMIDGTAIEGPEGSTGTRPLTAISDGRGFFQIAPVPAGEYSLQGRASGGAVATAMVQVDTGAETRLSSPLSLAPPEPFTVEITPPTAPSGKLWAVSMRPAFLSRRTIGAVAGSDGRARLLGVSAGEYVLHLEADGQRWHHARVRVDKEAEPSIAIRLDLVYVEGIVRLGRAPVVGRVAFGHFKGATRVVMTSDEAGRFQGLLPAPGEWNVDVELEAPRLRRTLSPVRVAADGGRAIEIAISDTRVSGQVIDADGRPVPGAAVEFDSETSSAADLFPAVTDDAGNFELLGLPPGRALLRASSPASGESAPVPVGVSDGQSIRGVRLILLPTTSVGLMVVSREDGRPVPGAVVMAGQSGDPFGSPVYHTDIDGRVVIRVPAGAKQLDVVVVSTDHATEMKRITLEAPGATMELSKQGGTLLIDVPAGPGEVQRLVLVSGGVSLPVGFLQAEKRVELRNDFIELSQMAAGEYQLCRMSRRQGPTRGEQCVTGHLRSGERVSLRTAGPP